MLEGERPIPEASFSPRLINGLPVAPCASSSFTWVPFVRRERPDAAVDAVRAAYASLCLPGDCYVCHRVHALSLIHISARQTRTASAGIRRRAM